MKTSQNDDPPDICRIGRMRTPGASSGTRNAVIPACLGTDGSVRAISSPQLANCAPELQIFWPLTTHSPSAPSAHGGLPPPVPPGPSPVTRSARVARPARSEPAPGSENSWQHSSSARRNGRTNRARCPGVPKMATVGATRWVVTENVSCPSGVTKPASASLKARSCASLSPAPPYSTGQVMAP